MNQSDIEYANTNTHSCPNVRKGVRLLHCLMHSVNQQSDGWAYWPVPLKACQNLIALLKTAGNLYHGTNGSITDSQLTKAIMPIRRMVTTQGEKQKKYGNTFSFDVDAAMNT